jgi:protoporphyrinogen oxidase
MKEQIVIIGAGVSGLTTAYFLQENAIVLEKEKTAGGLCKSIYDNGFTFDISGHFIHIKNPKIKSIIENLTGGLNTVSRNSKIYFNNLLMPFPFQANLYYLDEKSKQYCLKTLSQRPNIPISPDMSFYDWALAMFGEGICELFMRPYNEKLWNYDLKKMNAQWTGPFVAKPNIDEIIKSAHKKNETHYGYNTVFYYPRQNGCGALINGLTKKVKPCLNEAVEKIDIKNKVVYTSKAQYSYTKLVSTQGLKNLIAQIEPLPDTIRSLAECLKSTSVYCLNLGIKTKTKIPDILDGLHWIYFSQKDIEFYRLGIYSNAAPNSAPQNAYSFYVETTHKPNVRDIIDRLRLLGFIGTDDEICNEHIIKIDCAYVIFDNQKDEAVKGILEFLHENDIYSIGRYGAWEYSFIEKNVADALSLANTINGLKE